MPNWQPTAIDASPVTPIGNIVTAYDDTLGFGEFIYLPGVASLAIGDVVGYDLNPAGPTVVRSSNANSNNTGRALAVAINTVLAGQYGWFQISGAAIVNVVAGTAAGNPAFVSATTASLQSTAIAGAQILGARINTAVGTPAAGKAYVTLARPCMQTQIT
jgi:hypothetical protein